ncbi:MAG: protein phosphatase 2C domain-containing protein [Candidatus Riflebacteria bacterium]|nr:protein phosphatase 2C domain-containing protein [Candidatus Riflebacteria bacterium]
MRLSSYTHLGMVRRNNEDSCLVIPPWSSLAIERQACLFAVADGMGGQNAGEVASGIAMKSSIEWFSASAHEPLNIQLVEEMFAQINAAVWGHSQEHADTSGMGNTLTLMLIKGDRALVGHIGDTRLYRLRDGELVQLTHDHSLVAEQVRMGKLTPEQGRVHPTRHILSRVIGGRQFVVPDIFETDLQVNDVYLICSDGVTGMVEDAQIKDILLHNSPDSAAEKLVETANRAGGKDNSTAVTFAFEQLPVVFPSRYSLQRLASLLFNKVCAGGI